MGWEGGGWDYWMRWQTAVCFLITVSPAIAAAIVLKRRRRSRRSKEPQEQELECGAPCLRGVPPLVLPVYRGLVVVAMGSVLYAMLRHRGLLEFYFYTQWTFVLVIIYFLIGTLISAHACWLYSSQKTSPDVEHGNASILCHAPLLTTHTSTSTRPNPAAPLAYSMQIIYQTCAGAVMLTDVVFWCLLVPFMSSSHFSVNLVMGCMHSLNLLFLLVDTFLNSMPFPWFGITYFILWSCAYVIFQWILHACGFSWWPYPFLELATPWAPLWYFCMAVIHVPCYGMYWVIVKAKDTYLPRLFPHSYVKLHN